MKGLCLLISGGEYADIPRELKAAECVITCDRGWEYARRMNISIDLAIGDFDSCAMPDKDIPYMQFPSHKDDTDTMLAAREAIKRGYRNIAICCAFGGRLDHTLANIQTAAFLVSNGAAVRMYGKDTDAYILNDGDIKIAKKPSSSLSVFSLSDRCEGVSIKGTEYECENITLTNTFPLGVSKEWASEEAYVNVKNGILMVVCSDCG